MLILIMILMIIMIMIIIIVIIINSLFQPSNFSAASTTV